MESFESLCSWVLEIGSMILGPMSVMGLCTMFIIIGFTRIPRSMSPRLPQYLKLTSIAFFVLLPFFIIAFAHAYFNQLSPFLHASSFIGIPTSLATALTCLSIRAYNLDWRDKAKLV